MLLAGGILGMGLATGLYIGAGLGAGPRDGLSVGIVARGGYSMRVVRTSVEASVLLIGWLLGGTVGIGTVLFAVTIGPITHVTIPALAIDREPIAGASLGPLPQAVLIVDEELSASRSARSPQ